MVEEVLALPDLEDLLSKVIISSYELVFPPKHSPS
jgi:hypothetical protein